MPASNAFSNSRPSTTSPKTTCLPSRCRAAANKIKNCDPFVFGPLLAILSKPRRSWRILHASSANLPPVQHSPPVPSPLVKSPPWAMKSEMTRWNVVDA